MLMMPVAVGLFYTQVLISTNLLYNHDINRLASNGK